MKNNENLENKESMGWGIASLVTGILSLLLFLVPYIGLPLGIFGVVASRLQKRKTANGLSTAGFILSIIGIIINSIILLLVIMVVFIVGLFQ
jgi:hypothetical protein